MILHAECNFCVATPCTSRIYAVIIRKLHKSLALLPILSSMFVLYMHKDMCGNNRKLNRTTSSHISIENRRNIKNYDKSCAKCRHINKHMH